MIPQLISILRRPKKDNIDSDAIAPVTLKTMNNRASGATFGKICENKIVILDPPVILAESTKGFTFTCNAWDLIVITDPPNPPMTPKTIAKCQILSSAKADIINSKGRLGNINTKSDCLIK